MYDYDEEPRYEPTLADEIMVEYQQKMKDALLESVKRDIESVKNENERLKEENGKLQELVCGIQRRESSLEIEKSQFQRKLRCERLSELMRDMQVIMYEADYVNEELPKCSKCNEKRKIEFISPLGKSMTEKCSCDIGKKRYLPKENICVEFRINRDNNKMMAWYKIHRTDDYDYARYESSDLLEAVYSKDMKFEDLKRNSVFFKSKEECQKYCDWLNSKEVS